MATRQVVVFPRRTLFEQREDVTQLQVSGHEVLGWWVVARKEHDLDRKAAEERLREAQLPEGQQRKVLKVRSGVEEWLELGDFGKSPRSSGDLDSMFELYDG